MADEKGMRADELVDILKKGPDKLAVSKAALLDDVFGNTRTGTGSGNPHPGGTTYGPANEGLLKPQDANSFSGGVCTKKVLTEDTVFIVYRVGVQMK